MVSSQDDDPYTFIVSIIMMLIDAAFYWILTWYIENVFPGKHTFIKTDYIIFSTAPLG